MQIKMLNKHPTCSNNFNNPSGTDLLITNSGKSFESTCPATVLKEKHKCKPPKVIQHRDYSNFEYAILVKIFVNKQSSLV